MSYQVVRMAKIKATAVRGIQSHDRRERTPRSNPDVDEGRSGDNYALIDCDNYSQYIKDRLAQLPQPSKKIRSDAVMMMQCIITSDSAFFENMPLEEQKKFFTESLQFISERYGKENIMSAIVHMDEKTPHMHINFIPIYNNEKLCAKAIFKPAEYTNLQTAYYKNVAYKYGLERGGGKKKRRHEDTNTYKYKTGYDRLKEQYLEMEKKCQVIDEKIRYKQECLDNLQIQIRDAEDKIRLLNSVHILTRKELQENDSKKYDEMIARYKNLDTDTVRKLIGQCDICEDADMIEERKLLVQSLQKSVESQTEEDNSPTPGQ